MRPQAAVEHIVARLEKDLPKNLYYHSVAHTRDVLGRVVSLGKAEGVSPRELDLLRVAAAFHDAGFLVNNRNHEKLGCQLVRRILPDYDFSTTDVERICGMIMATKVPQSPRNALEEILCDADLDYLGRDDFHEIGQRLFRELRAYNLLSTARQWDELQVKFITAHRYWTATNRRDREPIKARHLARLRESLSEA